MAKPHFSNALTKIASAVDADSISSAETGR